MEDGNSKSHGNPKKRKYYSKDDSGSKKPKVDDAPPFRNCWECGKPGHFKRTAQSGKER